MYQYLRLVEKKWNDKNKENKLGSLECRSEFNGLVNFKIIFFHYLGMHLTNLKDKVSKYDGFHPCNR